MFNPKYIITPKLLENIKVITRLITLLNNKSFPNVILTKFEKKAQVLSTYASTSIEGNPLPLTQVKTLLKSKPKYIRDSQQEILNYNQALQYLYNKSNQDKISIDTVLKTQMILTKKLLKDHQSGKFRKEPVVVYDTQNRTIQYMSPNWQEVPQMVEDLLTYLNFNINKLDPLILAGIFHRQFVIIHPFIDGNGRTTRLITTQILKLLGINIFKLFSFENYYNNNVSKYIKKVGSFGDYYDLKDSYDFTEWLEYFTDGVIDELERISTNLKIQSLLPNYALRPHDIKLIKYIKKHGSITDNQYSKITNRAKATRNQDFNRLISLKKIKRIGQGKATYYIL
jgi:Fic family protein